MKSFDTIYRAAKKPVSSKRNPPEKYWLLFYKSLQVVLTFWVVTVLAIITQPWLDYWVKTVIKNNSPSQVLSENTTAPQANNDANAAKQAASFHLKNSQVNIDAPIVEGTDQGALKQGIGHHPESVWPNQKGNVVLAGHNFDLDAENPYGRVFISLRLVEIGDEVTISYQGKNYHYQVFKKETVSPKDTSLFGPTDDWLLTFYTCDPPYTDWKRLVLQARLIRIE